MGNVIKLRALGSIYFITTPASAGRDFNPLLNAKKQPESRWPGPYKAYQSNKMYRAYGSLFVFVPISTD